MNDITFAHAFKQWECRRVHTYEKGICLQENFDISGWYANWNSIRDVPKRGLISTSSQFSMSIIRPPDN